VLAAGSTDAFLARSEVISNEALRFNAGCINRFGAAAWLRAREREEKKEDGEVSGIECLAVPNGGGTQVKEGVAVHICIYVLE
jgi:hypothetical protein